MVTPPIRQTPHWSLNLHDDWIQGMPRLSTKDLLRAAELQPGVEKAGAFGCVRRGPCRLQIILVRGYVHLTRPGDWSCSID